MSQSSKMSILVSFVVDKSRWRIKNSHATGLAWGALLITTCANQNMRNRWKEEYVIAPPEMSPKVQN